jgi:phospholipase C
VDHSAVFTGGPAIGVVPTFAAAGKISHVVVIVQENRSFDNMFNGFPGADTVTSGQISSGAIVPLHPVPLAESYDLSHEENDFIHSFNGGRMNGFDQGSVATVGGSPNPIGAPPLPQYAFVDAAETEAYFALAKKYVLADRFFPSQIDSSFTAHQYLIAAQAGGTVDNPNSAIWGCDAQPNTVVPTLLLDRTQGPGIFPCFSYRTLGDELDAAGRSWRYYAPAIGGDSGSIWSAYDAIHGIRYGADWQRSVVSPETKILTDVATGTLADVTWVVPDLANSDHPAAGSTGPDWVAGVVNAVGASPFWSSTAIVIFWDDWGGWYDHVAPPQLDADGLGIRTPMLVVSPYAKKGYVSHVQYETGSIDRLIEGVFELSTLAEADARSTDLDDCFDFSAPPRAFSAFTVRTRPADLLKRRPSGSPPDTD